MTERRLRKLVLDSLREQGFCLKNRKIVIPEQREKADIRRLHDIAVRHRAERARKYLYSSEVKLLNRIASGNEIRPESISPRLVIVKPGSQDELLFRYASLHWSIPVSAGYGRRLRFLVIDGQNEKLIGLIGLGDPVFGLRARDLWIGWDREQHGRMLKHVMDAFVLGAVPPYSMLLGGKLVAMLAASDEVRKAFAAKYATGISLISQNKFDGRLALITTTSALGRSSIYNRLRFEDRLLFQPVGWTEGSGEFHFANGVYAAMSDFVGLNCEPTAKNPEWGDGFRSRREVVKKCLTALRLPRTLMYHGIRRQMFVVPLAHNTQAFLQGRHSRLRWHRQSTEDIARYFKDRWLIPRITSDHPYQRFDRTSYSLWRLTS